MSRGFSFAVFGDVHGRQVEMYSRVAKCHRPIDLLLQVGDFETHRDMADVASKTGPQKFRVLGEFHRLLTWERIPVPTAFIAGNHEAFRWLDDHENGFALLPGLEYLGRFGVRRLGPILVAGLSGIFHPARWSRATAYFRRYEMEGLARNLDVQPDVLLLHDWPAGLMPAQPGRGNAATCDLIKVLRPQYVFCGHHHFHAQGTIPHAEGSATRVVALGPFGGGTPDMAIVEVSGNGIELVELA